MAINKIEKKNITTEVYNAILDNIKTGVWKEGDKIPSENDLSESMGVSRVSLRNAVRKLVGQGILVSKHGEGTFISNLSIDGYFESMIPLFTLKKEQLIDLYEFRKILEVGNISMAVTNASDEDIELLEQNYMNMAELVHDIEAFVKADIEFHSILSRMTGNTVSHSINKILRNAILPTQLMVQDTFGTKGALKYHKAILEAVKNKDVDAAVSMMQEHMDATIKNIKSKPDIFAID